MGGKMNKPIKNIKGSALESDDLATALSTFTNEELQPLVNFLNKPVSATLEFEEGYKQYAPDHSKYAGQIARHIRTNGGNSFANFWRGAEGPSYAEVVSDVCDSRKVKLPEKCGLVEMERLLLQHELDRVTKSMSPEQAEALLRDLHQNGLVPDDTLEKLGQGMPPLILLAQVGGRASGFLLYSTGLQLVNAASKAILGQGLSFVGNQMLVRGLSVLTGPVGWALSGAWTVLSLSGPNERVTIPCVFHIAAIRQAKLWRRILPDVAQ
jgi:uncharacterized protein YaaW (UPF0174 family)